MEGVGSIIQCSKCLKSLVGFGSKVRRIHPVARFMVKHSIKILVLWFPFFTAAILALIYFWPSKVWTGIYAVLLPLPPFIVYFLPRCFPIYRITECPYCGSSHAQRLGYSISIDEL